MKKRWKQSKIVLFLSMFFILTGCAPISHAASGTVNWVNSKITKAMDNHKYKEIPWHLFLTKEDREILDTPVLTPLPGVDLQSYHVINTIDEINNNLETISTTLNDEDIYKHSLDDLAVLETPIKDILGDNADITIFKEVLDDIYARKYTYPDVLDLVALQQRRLKENHEWVLHLEWKALQDSHDYLVYPILLHLDDELNFVRASWEKPYESDTYARPLLSDAVIGESAHQEFLEEWHKFSRLFSKESESDKSHLESLATNNIPLEVLEELFMETKGQLSNTAITSWLFHDKEADAKSIYTLSVPLDEEGNQREYEIIYSRLLNKIENIRPKNNK